MRAVRQRRDAILQAIATREVRTQDELLAALRQAGVAASQASVSRDIAALGLVKAGGRYVLPARPRPARDPMRERIRENLLSIATAGEHLLVLKTPPGEASGVALAIDRLDFPGVVGTVAGDDTIFVAVSGREAGRAVAGRLRQILAAPEGAG